VSDLDEAALARWMNDNVPDFSRIDAVTKFPGGQSNPTYKVRTDTAAYALRRNTPVGPCGGSRVSVV
jgi:aminoglycoside phosphotransferase (APT) family kinase protein